MSQTHEKRNEPDEEIVSVSKLGDKKEEKVWVECIGRSCTYTSKRNQEMVQKFARTDFEALGGCATETHS